MDRETERQPDSQPDREVYAYTLYTCPSAAPTPFVAYALLAHVYEQADESSSASFQETQRTSAVLQLPHLTT